MKGILTSLRNTRERREYTGSSSNDGLLFLRHDITLFFFSDVWALGSSSASWWDILVLEVGFVMMDMCSLECTLALYPSANNCFPSHYCLCVHTQKQSRALYGIGNTRFTGFMLCHIDSNLFTQRFWMVCLSILEECCEVWWQYIRYFMEGN